MNRIQSNDVLDVKYGFDRYKESVERLGWLMNMHPVSQLSTFEFCISTKETLQMYKKTYITMEFRDLYVSFCCNEKIDADHLET